VIAAAVLEQDPDFAAGNREARDVIRQQFPNSDSDITTAEFVQLARKALAPGGVPPSGVNPWAQHRLRRC
jgi:hypothetical protein